MLAYGICFSLSDLLHSVQQTLGPSLNVNFFFTKYILHDPHLVESVDAEPQIQRADYKVIYRFLTAQRVCSPNLQVFLGLIYMRLNCIKNKGNF